MVSKNVFDSTVLTVLLLGVGGIGYWSGGEVERRKSSVGVEKRVERDTDSPIDKNIKASLRGDVITMVDAFYIAHNQDKYTSDVIEGAYADANRIARDSRYFTPQDP
jgi:hypothetical protein